MKTKNKDPSIIYICSPYSGNTARGAEIARRYSRYVVERGYAPVTPHLYLPLFISEETERELALGAGHRLLDMCSELWAYGGTISEGMRREISHAQRKGIPIRYVKEEEIYVRDRKRTEEDQ